MTYDNEIRDILSKISEVLNKNRDRRDAPIDELHHIKNLIMRLRTITQSTFDAGIMPYVIDVIDDTVDDINDIEKRYGDENQSGMPAWILNEWVARRFMEEITGEIPQEYAVSY